MNNSDFIIDLLELVGVCAFLVVGKQDLELESVHSLFIARLPG